MNISRKLTKKDLDKSLQTGNDFSRSLADGMHDLSTYMSETLKSIVETYKGTNDKVKYGVEICKELCKCIDDMIRRTPYTLETTNMLLDAYWNNKVAQHKLDLLQKYKDDLAKDGKELFS